MPRLHLTPQQRFRLRLQLRRTKDAGLLRRTLALRFRGSGGTLGFEHTTLLLGFGQRLDALLLYFGGFEHRAFVEIFLDQVRRDRDCILADLSAVEEIKN